MRHPQLLVYESDGLLARMLRPATRSRAGLGKTLDWSLREPRRPESCLRLLRSGGPGILVLKLGRDLVGELGLLEQVHWLLQDTPVVVACDTHDAALAGLAWDLGASFVCSPPRPRSLVLEVVTGLMETAAESLVRAPGPPAKLHPEPKPEPKSPKD